MAAAEGAGLIRSRVGGAWAPAPGPHDPRLPLRKAGFRHAGDAARWVRSLTPLGAPVPQGAELTRRILQARPELPVDAAQALTLLAEGAGPGEDAV